MHSTTPLISRSNSRLGFSVLEVLTSVVVIAAVAAMAIKLTASTKVSVQSAKLTADVQKLNEVVSVYLANGGTIAGTNPQAVLDQLKTVTSAEQATQNVGVMTGRGVDKRLVALMQTDAETGSVDPRALWDNTNKRFYVSTTAGAQGVSNFTFNDELAASAASYDSNRTQSNFTYNNAVGWVWAPGAAVDTAFLDASNQTLVDQENKYNPLLAGSGSGSGSGGPSSGIPDLPSPIPSPSSAAFWPSLFPSAIYLNPNGAPEGTSVLTYKVNNGSWLTYTGPFSVAPGSTVTSKNVSTDTTLYHDSPEDVSHFYTLATNFSGTVNAYWSNQTNFNSNGAAISGSPGHGGPAVFVFNQFGEFTNEPASFGGVTANSLFQLGHLVYHNGNITGAYLNGEYIPVNGSTLLTLNLDITLTQPAGFSGTAQVDLTIEANSDGGSAKLILNNPVTNFTFLYGGVKYTLHCQFENANANGSTDLLGAFVGEIPL